MIIKIIIIIIIIIMRILTPIQLLQLLVLLLTLLFLKLPFFIYKKCFRILTCFTWLRNRAATRFPWPQSKNNKLDPPTEKMEGERDNKGKRNCLPHLSLQLPNLQVPQALPVIQFSEITCRGEEGRVESCETGKYAKTFFISGK